MLENIKMLLNIDNSEHDNIINYWINKVEKRVLEYCNIKEIDVVLEGFIEDKVVSILNNLGAIKVDENSNEPNLEIKSITRGDTSITYNTPTATSKVEIIDGANLTSYEKTFLNKFRRLKF